MLCYEQGLDDAAFNASRSYPYAVVDDEYVRMCLRMIDVAVELQQPPTGCV